MNVPKTVQLRPRALHPAKQTLTTRVLLLARYEIEASGRRTVGHHDVDIRRDLGLPEVVLGARVAECPLAAFGLVGGGEDGEGRAFFEGEGMCAFGQADDVGLFC